MTHAFSLPHGIQNLVETLPTGLVVLDGENRVVYANQQFLQRTGYREEALAGRPFLEVLVPEKERDRIKAALAPRQTLHFPCPLLTHDGSLLHTEIEAAPFDNGGPAPFIGMVVTPVHRALPAVDPLHPKTALPGIFDTAQDGIVIITADGYIAFVNLAVELLFGYRAEEVIGCNVSCLMPQPYKDAHDGYLAAYFKTGRAKIIGKGREVTARRKDGTVFPIFLTVGREFTMNGKLCFAGFVRDLSREKGIESQLRQSQKMESIGTLAGGIAHDFNNILGGIMGYIDLMLEDTDPESYLFEDLNEMRAACTRGKDLILQILTFSRQDKTQKIPVQFHPIVKESLKLLRAIIPANIDIQCRADKDTPTVMADATQVHQIMMNLCTNAYHAMSGENDVIEVVLEVINLDELHEGPKPNLPFGKYVVLRIRDNGSGMDPHTIARIFDPFFTTKSQGKGTGMGLAVVHGIVQNHGGDIVVESTPGEGSCFHLFFPAWEEEAEEELPRTVNRPQGRENIMLVDDDKLLLKVQNRILSRRGYSVTTFTNGQDALEAFRKAPRHYDLVITDQTMPRLTGMELASALLGIREDVPILITTGFSDVITPDKVAARGIRDLLRKPVDSEELTGAVRRVLDEAEADEQA